MVRIEFAQLVFENPPEIVRTFQLAERQFGRKPDPVAPMVPLQRAADRDFAPAAQVEIGGVHIVDPRLETAAEQIDCRFKIGFRPVERNIRDRQPHRAETER